MKVRKHSFIGYSLCLIACICSMPVLVSAFLDGMVNREQGASAVIQPVSDQKAPEQAKVKMQDLYGQIPLYFIENQGQMEQRVKYYEKNRGHGIYFTEAGVTFTLSSPEVKAVADAATGGVREARGEQEAPLVIELKPLGASDNAKLVAEDAQSARVSYFIGSDPKQWKTNLSTFKSVSYQEIYPGIDLKFYGNEKQLEYDVIVKPGADPSQVRLLCNGAKSMEVTDQGELSISIGDNKSIVHKKPSVYQIIDGKRIDVDGRFVLEAQAGGSQNNVYGFEVASYDKECDLVIDPVIDYSSYLGGSNFDEGNKIAIDAEGNAYIIGMTISDDFPFATGGVFQATREGNYDAFVVKINAAGDAVAYFTYFGGNDDDYGIDITVDAEGNAYLTGLTESSHNFPILPSDNPIQDDFGGATSDAFVAKLNAAGDTLVYSTYLGGLDDDFGVSIAVDAEGNAYVTGLTESSHRFPVTANAIQGEFGGGVSDAFVAKINAAGNALSYCTYLGGDNDELGAGIAVDAEGGAYVAGWTASSLKEIVDLLEYLLGASGSIDVDGSGAYTGIGFPTTENAIQSEFGGGYSDAFVTKINAAGDALAYSTYLGGPGMDGATGIAVDAENNAYVTGAGGYDPNTGLGFPLLNAIQPYYSGGVSDAFIAKIDAAGDALSFSTYFGGSGDDSSNDIVLDASGNVYITGMTSSSSSVGIGIPTENAVQSSNAGGASDAFVISIDAAGSEILFSTYLGGSGDDIGTGIAVYANGGAVDVNGGMYVSGWTTSGADFPTLNALQAVFGGAQDAFIAKISIEPVAASFTATPTAGVAPLSVGFTDTSLGDYSSRQWDFGDGETSTEQNPTHTYGTPGTYSVSLTVTGLGGSDTATQENYLTVTENSNNDNGGNDDNGGNGGGGGNDPAPVAGFTASSTSGAAPHTVSFTDDSTGEINSWAWDFGDGETSTEQNPTHTYSTAGSYEVTLTVTGPGGSDTATYSSIKVTEDTVESAPIAGFTVSSTSGAAPLRVSFTDVSTGEINSWAWDFGDGETSTEQNPTHTYSTAGSYEVTLTVTGPWGSDTATQDKNLSGIENNNIEVGYAAPVAGYSAASTSGTSPLQVSFTDTSVGVIDTWHWNFGDGQTAAEQNPVHTYKSSGVYVATLTVSGPGGASSSSQLSFIRVEPNDPTWTAWNNYFAVDSLEKPMVGDFNGDGRTDIVTFTRNNPVAEGDVYVALSDGSQFGESTIWHNWFGVGEDEQLNVGDFNGDGMDDVATWLPVDKKVYVSLSDGVRFGASSVWIEGLEDSSDDEVMAGDADGDGKTDLIFFSRGNNSVYVALSTGRGFSTPALWHSYFAVDSHEKPGVGDFNGDGKTDIVTFLTDSPGAEGDVYVALSTGAQFEDGIYSQKWHDWFGVDPKETVVIGDLNGDGRDDFFTFLPASSSHVYVAYSQENGMSDNELWNDQLENKSGNVPFAADVNGDDKADLIVFRQSEGTVFTSLAP
jgi:PKD repeat protein